MDALLLVEMVADGLLSPSVAVGTICESVSEFDLKKTAYGLVKSNKGNWKSEKQGMFLINSAADLSKMRMAFNSNNAKDWLAKKGYDTSKLVAIAWSEMLKGYGVKDPSKRRYIGSILVFDEKGVVLIGSIKVLHAKKGDEREGLIDWSKVTTKYERPKDHKPSVIINYFNRSVDQASIDLIRSIPDYQDHEILLSFLSQLRDHRKLSPKQKLILNKFLPEPKDVGVGAKKDLQKDLDTFYSLVRTKFLPVFSDAITQHDWKTLKWRSLPDEWTAFSKGAKYEHGNVVHFVTKELGSILGKITGRPKKIYQQDFLHITRDKVKRAFKAKNIGKSHVEAIENLRWLNKKLEDMPVSKIREHFQLD